MSKIEGVPKKVDVVYGKIKGYAVTTSPDSFGRVFTMNILEKSLEFFKQNPFIYLDHDRSRPPIARLVSQRIVKTDGYFALEQEHEVLDAETWKKIQSGELRGLSVGGVLGNE
jgi:hypothetical protein